MIDDKINLLERTCKWLHAAEPFTYLLTPEQGSASLAVDATAFQLFAKQLPPQQDSAICHREVHK
jgi:hypothetical protein